MFSVNIEGSPYFVARTKRALETLARTASVFITDVTTRVRTIWEVSSYWDTPGFALTGRNNEVLLVNWSELRNSYHPIQYAALLAWHSRDSAEHSRLAGDAEDGASIAELRFMREVCEEAGASAHLLDHIDYQLRRYYDQEP
ncbi:hypothetical protein [Aeoliella sp. SH292]|uniref:hypothetical protein n=1 Tax=Aeoliella sp. SH292 TaxID=3454464 RepID=UPI003F96DEF8